MGAYSLGLQILDLVAHSLDWGLGAYSLDAYSLRLRILDLVDRSVDWGLTVRGLQSRGLQFVGLLSQATDFGSGSPFSGLVA